MKYVTYEEPLFYYGKPPDEERMRHEVAFQNEMNILWHFMYMQIVNKIDKGIMGEKEHEIL